MKDLAEKLVTSCYTPEEMQEIETLVLTLMSKLKTPPAMSDDEFDALSKMATVKRKLYGDKLEIIKKYPSVISDKESIDYMDSSLLFFDQSSKISDLLTKCDKKNWRTGDVAGSQVINQVSFSESEIELKKMKRDADAIEAYNELQRLKPVRKSSGNKNGSNNADDTKK